MMLVVRYFSIIVGLASVLICGASHGQDRTPMVDGALKPEAVPKTAIYDGEHLARIRAGLLRDDKNVARSFEHLELRAKEALTRKPRSVVEHGELAASGDPHDYVSFAPYWWPNPNTPDGLPYVRRDGVSNKELTAQGDRELLGRMTRDVTDLALAGYLLDQSQFSEHAVLMLRTWFIEAETRMNPHLKHGQLIRGVNTGRSIGIIDSRDLVMVCEAVKLLELYRGWSDQDSTEMVQWMDEYLTWLREHPFGKAERREKNNHGTYYDFQVAGLALFVGKTEIAKSVVEEVTLRIDAQIKPDGQQPAELRRTRGLSYSFFNFRAFCLLARLAEQVEVDLWSHPSESGSSICAAYDFMVPYLMESSSWPHQQITPEDRPWDALPCYLIASRFNEPEYLQPALDENGLVRPSSIAPLVFSKD